MSTSDLKRLYPNINKTINMTSSYELFRLCHKYWPAYTWNTSKKWHLDLHHWSHLCSLDMEMIHLFSGLIKKMFKYHVNLILPYLLFTLEKEQDNKLPIFDIFVARTQQGFRSLFIANIPSVDITSISTPIIHIMWRKESSVDFNIEQKSFVVTLSVEFLKVYVQKTKMQQYYLSTSPRPLTQYTEERLSKYYSPSAYP